MICDIPYYHDKLKILALERTLGVVLAVSALLTVGWVVLMGVFVWNTLRTLSSPVKTIREELLGVMGADTLRAMAERRMTDE